MDLKKAIEVLDNHQQWRLGDDDIIQTNARELTESIELILCEVKKLDLRVSGSCEWCGTEKENPNGLCKECGRFPSPSNPDGLYKLRAELRRKVLTNN